jgi:hypothetical protein
VRFQKLMWRNMMRSTKSQKASILHYIIDYMHKGYWAFLVSLIRRLCIQYIIMEDLTSFKILEILV